MAKSKLNKIIEKFVNDAIGASYDEYITITDKYDEFSANADDSKICVPKWKGYKFNKKTLADEEFELYFYSVSNYAKEFSLVTLSILHELGHLATEDDIPDEYNREKELNILCKKAKNKKELNRMYFRLYDEKMATLWAAKWLSVKANRKLAKEFEEEFYATLLHK